MSGNTLPKNSPLLASSCGSVSFFSPYGMKRSRFHSRHYLSIPLDARLCIDFWLATGPPSERKVAVDYPFLPDDVLWDYSKLRFYAFSTFLAGVVLAGLIGIGGGMVLGPLMLVQWASILESRPTLPPP
jgi:hypothetical protein